MRSGDTSYNLFINMMFTQAFRILRDLADNVCPGGKLPIHVRFIIDEFYAGPKPADTEMLLGEIRSRTAMEVINGKWGNGDERKKSPRASRCSGLYREKLYREKVYGAVALTAAPFSSWITL